jgi:dTDP-4-amino-4,6-dideoxygalactose transaminase
MPVHEFGLACDMDVIHGIAKERDLMLIEDAACAFGAKSNGRFVGAFGNAGAFSLHPRKAITAGEGGLLTTNDERLAAKLRSLRNHGIEVLDGRQEFTGAGLNYRLTDFQAALVWSQFRRLEENLAAKSRLAEVYLNELKDVTGIMPPAVPRDKVHTWQTFHVILDESIDRDNVIANLKSKGVGTNFGAHCIPATAYYQAEYGFDCELEFPNAMRAYRQGLALPIYEKLSGDEVRYICDTLKQVAAG